MFDMRLCGCTCNFRRPATIFVKRCKNGFVYLVKFIQPRNNRYRGVCFD